MKKLSMTLLVSLISAASAAAYADGSPNYQNQIPGTPSQTQNSTGAQVSRPPSQDYNNTPQGAPDTSGSSGTSGTSSGSSDAYGRSSPPDSSGSSGTSGTSIDSTRGMSSDKGDSGTPGDSGRAAPYGTQRNTPQTPAGPAGGQ